MKYDLYIVLVGRFLQVIASIMLLKIMTNRLDPGEMGKYSLIISLVSFFSLIFINPVGMYINRKLHDWYEEGILGCKLKGASYYVYVVTLISIVLVSIIYVSMDLNWNIDIYWLIILVGGSLIINTFNQTLIPSLNMLGKRLEWVVLTLISLLSGLIISTVLTLEKANAELWIVGQILGMLLGFGLSVVPFRKLVKKVEPKSKDHNCILWEIKPVLQFAIPIAFTVGLSWLQFQSYKFIVSEMGGIEYLGLFATGYALSAGIMSAFEATVTNYFGPIFYNKIHCVDDKGKMEAWNQYASVVIPLTLYTAVVIIVMANQLTHLLVSKVFWFSAKFVIFGALTESGRVIGNVYSMAAHAMMQPKILVKPQIIGAVFSVVLVPALTILLPDIGVGVALTIATVFFVYFLHRSVITHFVVSVDITETFKKLLLIIPVIIVGFLSSFITSNIFVDISFLVVSGVLYIAASYKILKHNFIK